MIEKTLTGTVAGVHAFGYDPVGNMTTMQKSGGTPNAVNVTTRAHNTLNQVTSLSGGGATRFYYNALGQRIVIGEMDGATFTDLRFLAWDGIQLLSLRKGPASSGYTGAKYERRYYPQGEQTIYQDPPTGNLSITATHHYTRDHLGSVREVVKTDGTLQARYDYDPYGKRIAQYESTAYGTCPFGFTGHYTQKSPIVGQGEIVLTHFRAYDPELGRWLSADPLGEEGGINLYGYVVGNPIIFVDEYGLNRKSKIAAVLAAIAGIINSGAGHEDYGFDDIEKSDLRRCTLPERKGGKPIKMKKKKNRSLALFGALGVAQQLKDFQDSDLDELSDLINLAVVHQDTEAFANAVNIIISVDQTAGLMFEESLQKAVNDYCEE